MGLLSQDLARARCWQASPDQGESLRAAVPGPGSLPSRLDARRDLPQDLGPALLRMLRELSCVSQLGVSGPPVVRPSWSTPAAS